MNAEVTTVIVREAMVIAVGAAGPLIIGFVVSIFQATTQISEPTLTFAPKAIGVGAVFAALAPSITHDLVSFIRLSFDRAASVLQTGGF